MAWADRMLEIATGGLYTLGKKTVYEAGRAAEQASEAAEEIADGMEEVLTIAGSTMVRLGEDLTSFINELEGLMAAWQEVPRSEGALTKKETGRVRILRIKEAELLAELRSHGWKGDDLSLPDFLADDSRAITDEMKEKARILGRLAVVRAAIDDILHRAPGVVPVGAHFIKESLLRFNTIEQPRIEMLLDAAGDTLEESEGVLGEVKALFAARTWKPVAISELSEDEQQRLEQKKAERDAYARLIEKHTALALNLQEELARLNPGLFSAPAGDAGGCSPEPGDETGSRAEVPPHPQYREIDICLGNYTMVRGLIGFYERERQRIDDEIFRIEYLPVDEPGPIPATLDEMRQSLRRFREVEQPRIESLLDSIDDAVAESRSVLADAGQSAKAVRDACGTLQAHGVSIKVGAAIFGALIAAILIATLIVLIRLAMIL